MADRAQLEQALLNLCLNARDAMPHGGLLTLRVETLDVSEGSLAKFYGVAPGCYQALTVADEGTGMTPEVRERMFEPFFTTKPTGQGTGPSVRACNRTSRLLPLPAAGHTKRVLAGVAWVSAALIVLYVSILQPFHVS